MTYEAVYLPHSCDVICGGKPYVVMRGLPRGCGCPSQWFPPADLSDTPAPTGKEVYTRGMGLDGNVGKVGPVNTVLRVVLGASHTCGKMIYTDGCQQSVCPPDTVNTGGWLETLSG